MSSIEKRLRDELGELASWLIDRRAESSSVEQADSGSDSIPRGSGSDSIPRLDLDADTVRPGGRVRLFRVAAVLVLIVGLVGASGLLSEDPPSVVTVPSDPATQTPTTGAPTTSVSPTTTVDDPSTDDPSIESSLEDLAPEVELAPDVPPSEAIDETSIEAEEWLVGPFGGSAYGDQQVPPSLFPWGDGFVKIGYLNTSEQVPTEINLFAQTSDDGLNWEQPFQVNLPREHFEALETDSWPIVRSNGEHLVVLSQLPGRHFGDQGASAVLSWRSAPASAHIEQRVFVSVTDDLERWDHYEYPLLPPDGVHESLANHIVVEDVIVSDKGWMIQISTLTYMDIGLLVPDNIRESAKEIRWLTYDDGEWVNDDGEWVSDNDGLLIEWIIEDTNSGSTGSHRKFFSWEELGFTEDLFSHYGYVHMRPNHPSHRYTGSVLVARWSEGPVRIELPWGEGVCCEIIATDSGYIGLSDGVEPGYAPGQFGWGTLLFSADGLTWQRIDPPADDGFKESENHILWIPSIHAVGDRVVMYGLDSWSRDSWSYGCGDGSRFQLEYIWVGDAKGSNWESQNISDNPCHARYRIAKSAGRGILLYVNVQLDNSEEPYTWEGRYHSTIVSIDGVNWFTFYEEQDPKRSSVAFNGNVAVRVDNAGKSYRYELP